MKCHTNFSLFDKKVSSTVELNVHLSYARGLPPLDATGQLVSWNSLQLSQLMVDE